MLCSNLSTSFFRNSDSNFIIIQLLETTSFSRIKNGAEPHVETLNFSLNMVDLVVDQSYMEGSDKNDGQNKRKAIERFPLEVNIF